MTNIIEQLDSEQIKSDIPEFAPGDTIRVQVKIKEGSREPTQTLLEAPGAARRTFSDR